MVGAIAAPLYIAARSTVETTPLENRATPNVAQETGADDFPPKGAELVFTSTTQGRFADTETFIAVAQSGSETPDVFSGNVAKGYSNLSSAQDLNQKLDKLLKDLEA